MVTQAGGRFRRARGYPWAVVATFLRDRAEIERYLGSLRYYDRRSWQLGETAERVVRNLLRAHTITVERGQRDLFEGTGASLETWLSLLDDPERRARVSEVCLHMSALGSRDRQLQAIVMRGASAG